MDEKQAAKIERQHGKQIDTVLPPEYRKERVGRYNVMVPYYRIRFKGQRRFVFVRGEIH